MKLLSSFVELFLLLHLLVAGHVFQLIEGELLNENKRKLSSRPFNFHKVIKDKNALSFLALDERSSRRAMKGRRYRPPPYNGAAGTCGALLAYRSTNFNRMGSLKNCKVTSRCDRNDRHYRVCGGC